MQYIFFFLIEITVLYLLSLFQLVVELHYGNNHIRKFPGTKKPKQTGTSQNTTSI